VSLVSALVNLYAIPLYTLLIVPAVLVSSAVAMLSSQVGNALLGATAGLIELTWPLIQVPADWQWATWSLAALEPAAWCALLVGTVAVLAPLPWSGRLAGGVLMIAACAWRPPPLPHGAARFTVLDVGQGLSVVVETRRHSLVFDAGPSFRTGSDTGQLVVEPYLRSRGLRALDMLVVSHDDDDHAGGARSVLERIPTRQLRVGPSLKTMPAAQLASQRGECRRGDAWDWDGVRFEWLHPGPGPYPRDNDGSCVLQVTAGPHAALITGDVEGAAEAEILGSTRIGAVDIVVAPHHGSRTSSSAAFVAVTRPDWIVYAVGHRNRWNFPAARVVQRWEQAGAAGLRTSESGAITFEILPADQIGEPQQWRLLRERRRRALR
jgi:competence protein ComEC